jgi:hypothetical protein
VGLLLSEPKFGLFSLPPLLGFLSPSDDDDCSFGRGMLWMDCHDWELHFIYYAIALCDTGCRSLGCCQATTIMR